MLPRIFPTATRRMLIGIKVDRRFLKSIRIRADRSTTRPSQDILEGA